MGFKLSKKYVELRLSLHDKKLMKQLQASYRKSREA